MKLKSFLFFLLLGSISILQASDRPLIKIETERTSLIYQVGDNGRLYQKYLGKRLNHDSDIQFLPQGTEAYLTHGNGALKKIIAYDENAHAVMVTAAGQKNKMVDAIKLGANEFVQKPFEPDQILSVIGNITKK